MSRIKPLLSFLMNKKVPVEVSEQEVNGITTEDRETTSVTVEIMSNTRLKQLTTQNQTSDQSIPPVQGVTIRIENTEELNAGFKGN